MEEQEIYEVLKNFRTVLEELTKRVEEMDTAYHQIQEQYDERFHNLEDTFYNQILGEARKAIEEQNAKEELEEYRAKYADKFDSISDKLRAIEGPDFDIAKQTLDTWKQYAPVEGDEELDEASFIDEMVAHCEAQLQGVRDAIGAAPDEKVELVSNEEGETELKVDGETVAEAEAPAEEAPVEEEAKEEPEAEETEEESFEEADDMSPEEIKQLEEEMKAEGLI